MNDPLEALMNLLARLAVLGIFVLILTVFARLTWLAVVYIWTFGAG